MMWKVLGFFVANTINAGFLLQKWFEHTCFVAKTIYTHFFVTKTIYALFCHKKNLRILFLSRKQFSRFFLSRKRFTHFIRKVFAHWKLPSGKFRLFGPLPNCLSTNKSTFTLSINLHFYLTRISFFNIIDFHQIFFTTSQRRQEILKRGLEEAYSLDMM